MSGQLPNADEIPLAVADDETIVRALLCPYHVKNGKVRWQALKPPAGKTSISVIRQCMGDDFCKSKAVELADKVGPKMKPTNIYNGLLAMTAAEIRRSDATVNDSREEYLGHADLDYGVPAAVQHEPAETPAAQVQLKNKITALLATAIYHSDPSPNTAPWEGTSLKI